MGHQIQAYEESAFNQKHSREMYMPFILCLELLQISDSLDVLLWMQMEDFIVGAKLWSC